MTRRLPALLASLALGVAAPAAHADRVVTLKGFDAHGPAKLDKVRVLQMGSARATHVLVLEPGTSGGGAYFRPVARAARFVRPLDRAATLALDAYATGSREL